MESLVSMIETVKNNITELKDKQKKNKRDLSALLEEQKDIEKNIKMFERILEDLNKTRNDEIQEVMAENNNQLNAKEIPVESLVKNKSINSVIESERNGNYVVTIKHEKSNIHHNRQPVAINAIDEKNEIIAKYSSTNEAGKDLKISQSTVCYRIAKVSVEKQIERYGYALVKV